MTLYENLSRIERATIASVVSVLQQADFNPSATPAEMPYMKPDLCSGIIEKLGDCFIPTMEADTLYHTIPKEPMKRIYYGLRLLDEMPANFMKALHCDEYSNWLEMCFAVGAWARRYPLEGQTYSGMPENVMQMTLSELVARYTRDGMDRLGREYYRRKKKGEYDAHQQIPFDSQIRDELNRAIAQAAKEGAPTIEEILRGEIASAKAVKITSTRKRRKKIPEDPAQLHLKI